jgi:SWI/SNF-related matrix-associated actin-dependent regulator of chromatin subfamily A3
MEDEDPVSLFLSLESWQESHTDPNELSPTQDSPRQSPTETYMLGFIIANIVGIQYYSGTISGREMVGLVWEPLNPHDSNAIKVLNT